MALKTTHALNSVEKDLLTEGYVCVERLAGVQTWVDLTSGGQPIIYRKIKGSKKEFTTRGRTVKSLKLAINLSRAFEIESSS